MSSMEALSRHLVALTKANVADLEDLLKGGPRRQPGDTWTTKGGKQMKKLPDGRIVPAKHGERGARAQAKREDKAKRREERRTRTESRREDKAKRSAAYKERIKASVERDASKKKARDAKVHDRKERFTPKAKPEGLSGHASTAYDVLAKHGPMTFDWQVLKTKMSQEANKRVSDTDAYAAMGELYDAGVVTFPRRAGARGRQKDMTVGEWKEAFNTEKVRLRGKMAPARKARRSRLWW